jgi:hypothetical protein
MRASSCSRSSHPLRKSASLHDIVDHPAASFPDTYPPRRRTCLPTSDTSRPSSSRQTSLRYDRRASSAGRSRQPRRMTQMSPPPQARVTSHSRSANSKTRCCPAARSPRCSTRPRQPLVVAPAGGVGPARGEPTLFRKLQAAKKEEVKSPAKTLKATSRMQGITEEGDGAYKKQGEDVQMKELQSRKARIVARMVLAQSAQISHSTESRCGECGARGRTRRTTCPSALEGDPGCSW